MLRRCLAFSLLYLLSVLFGNAQHSATKSVEKTSSNAQMRVNLPTHSQADSVRAFLRDSTRGYSKETAREALDNLAETNLSDYFSRDSYRNQVKILAMTMLLALAGVMFTINATRSEPGGYGVYFILASFLVSGFYIFDISLLSVNQRQSTLVLKAQNYLLRWDSINEARLAEVKNFFDEGFPPSQPWKKVRLALSPGFNDVFWYFLSFIPFVYVFFSKMNWDGVKNYWTLKKESLVDRWKKSSRR